MRALFAFAFALGVLGGCSTQERVTKGVATPARASSLAPAAERPAAPALDGATSWLNVDRPLDLAALKGRVVVVDFWTSGCINCIHTLATLKKLEAKYEGKPVVVLGVHSPKFDAEGESARRGATRDANDHHQPVAVDGKRAIWDRWGAKAWPTVMVLDTEGRIVARGSGEPTLDALSASTDDVLAEAGDHLAKGPLPGVIDPKADLSPLRFPGKVSALGDGRLAVSDTGHHRIVVLKADGAVETIIGSGLAGNLDGGFADASFAAPQGTSYENGILYIADSENHEIRAANLGTRTVTTLAGTGSLARTMLDAAPAPARTTALRSPWDVLAKNGQLFVALAGSHQVGVIELGPGTIRRFAGSGREALTDGSADGAAFAQPSGLASDGTSLYVADPESSAIRKVDAKTGATTTLIGKGLFEFGDRDGTRDTALLQHALGVAVLGKTLYIVDTYNSKLKALDLGTSELRTITGGKDRKDLFEPGGITTDGQRLVIADTHHERLVSFMPGGKSVSALAVSGLTANPRGVAVAKAGAPTALDPKAPELRLGWQVAKAGPTTVRIAWQLPAGTGINEDAPAALRWVAAKGLARLPDGQKGAGRALANGIPIGVELTDDAATLDGILDVVTCDVATHQVCIPLRRNVRATITRGPAEQLVAQAALPPALAAR